MVEVRVDLPAQDARGARDAVGEDVQDVPVAQVVRQNTAGAASRKMELSATQNADPDT